MFRAALKKYHPAFSSDISLYSPEAAQLIEQHYDASQLEKASKEIHPNLLKRINNLEINDFYKNIFKETLATKSKLKTELAKIQKAKKLLSSNQIFKYQMDLSSELSRCCFSSERSKEKLLDISAQYDPLQAIVNDEKSLKEQKALEENIPMLRQVARMRNFSNSVDAKKYIKPESAVFIAPSDKRWLNTIMNGHLEGVCDWQDPTGIPACFVQQGLNEKTQAKIAIHEMIHSIQAHPEANTNSLKEENLFEAVTEGLTRLKIERTKKSIDKTVLLEKNDIYSKRALALEAIIAESSPFKQTTKTGLENHRKFIEKELEKLNQLNNENRRIYIKENFDSDIDKALTAATLSYQKKPDAKAQQTS